MIARIYRGDLTNRTQIPTVVLPKTKTFSFHRSGLIQCVSQSTGSNPAANRTACKLSHTSCTRTMLAPPHTAATIATKLPGNRLVTGAPVTFPMNRLREEPTNKGCPSPANLGKPDNNPRLSSTPPPVRFPNPTPGSRITRSLPTPAFNARSLARSRKPITSATTSPPVGAATSAAGLTGTPR